jgi:hypothetical protein
MRRAWVVVAAVVAIAGCGGPESARLSPGDKFVLAILEKGQDRPYVVLHSCGDENTDDMRICVIRVGDVGHIVTDEEKDHGYEAGDRRVNVKVESGNCAGAVGCVTRNLIRLAK